MADLKYPIVVRPLPEEDGGGYIALTPDLKGCVGDGATPEEAIADLESAIAEWIDEARRLNRKIPQPDSFAKKATKERADLTKLIEKQQQVMESQQEVLKSQREALKNAQDEVEAIKKRLEALAACADSDDDDLMWIGAPAAMLVLSSKISKRHKNGDLPH